METNPSSASFSIRKKTDTFLKSGFSSSDSNSVTLEARLLIEELITYQTTLEKQNAELIKAESEFKKERQYFNDIFSNQPAGLYRIQVSPIDKWKNKSWESSENPPYNMDFASDRFCEILGLTRTEFENNPFIISDLVYPDDKNSFITKNEEANKRFIPFQWEGRLVVKEKIISIRLESLPRMLGDGDVLWTGILYDLTDDKLTEYQLTENRLRLEDVFVGANVGTLEWNVQTGKIKFNNIWARNLGYTSLEIKIGLIMFGKKGWKAITHPDDIPYAEAMLQRHFSGELPYHTVEVRMRHKKGHWVWIRQEGKVKTWTSDGKPLLMYGTHTDISKRKEMEIELRDNEEKYRILFSNNPQPMLIFNLQTLRVLEVNEAFISHYGYSRKEILKMSISDIRPAEDIPEMMIALAEKKAGAKNISVKRHIKKNGEIIFVELKTHTIKFKDVSAIHVLINDITEQKRIEQALFDLNNQLEERILERTSELTELNASLLEAKIKFKTVSDFTYDWEYWKSPDNKILFMSPSVERITGYTVKEFDENPLLIDSLVYQNDHDSWEKHKNERHVLEPDENMLESVFRIVTKTGDIRWIGHVCRSINIEGKYLGVRVSNRDITEKVNAENELLNITVDVEERERNRFSSELHDGMGPLLSTIKLYFQWLAGTTDEEKRKLITEKGNYSIEMAIQTARELASGLSSRFISEAGYVDAINDFVQRINDASKIMINFETNTNERFSGFFELMLYRITTELIKNTLTYANATNVEISYNYEKSRKTVSFLYKDNGVGFDWEKLKKERKGLGLMNIQQRVQILKGTIEIKTKQGEGFSTFLVIPVEEN